MFINERDRKVELTKNEYKKAHVYGTEEYKALQEIRKDYPGITPVIKKAKKNNSMGMTIEAIKEIVQTLDAGRYSPLPSMVSFWQRLMAFPLYLSVPVWSGPC